MTSRCLISIVLLLVACSSARPVADRVSEVETGTYSFQGTVTETHRYLAGVRSVERSVAGTVRVDEAGYEIESSDGGCSGMRRVSNVRRIALSCPEIVVALGTGSSLDSRLRVRVVEVHERRGGCIEWTTDNGRRQCVQYETLYDEQSAWRNATNVVVTRTEP